MMSGDNTENSGLGGLKWRELQQGVAKSWIREVRLQRNMQGKQLAKMMRVSPARISVLEKDERRGAVTLKMMQKAAAALDCDFVYALVPKHKPQAAKPKIRLDSTYMNSDKSTQIDDLELALESKLLRTIRD